MVEREVLLAPDVIARGAAAIADGAARQWMLSQPRQVRRSYVHDVLDQGDDETSRQRWMLRAPDSVRESYLELVLPEEPGGSRPEVLWMLHQPDAVRESYVEQVIDADPSTHRPDIIWMLRQPDAVRESYIEDVIRHPKSRIGSADG